MRVGTLLILNGEHGISQYFAPTITYVYCTLYVVPCTFSHRIHTHSSGRNNLEHEIVMYRQR
jgi:hypothetical protein